VIGKRFLQGSIAAVGSCRYSDGIYGTRIIDYIAMIVGEGGIYETRSGACTAQLFNRTVVYEPAYLFGCCGFQRDSMSGHE
jgi:hypothetical protein